MTKKERYTFHQNGNNHTVIDEEENIPLIMIEFKENEFPVYACFHRIIDLLNEKDNRIKELERHIERNMISRITVEDVLGCARDMRFYNNEEIIKAIDCIAKDLKVNID